MKEYQYCLRCGRRLTKYEHKKRGYGDRCFELVQSRLIKQPLFKENLNESNNRRKTADSKTEKVDSK